MALRLPALIATFGCLLVGSCASPGASSAPPQTLTIAREIKDLSRGRSIPVQLYGAMAGRALPLAILLPGYGMRSSDYRFLADELVSSGFVVAAVQHQISGDPPVPSGENIAVRRRPFWQRGIDDLRFVATSLRLSKIATDSPLLVAGHSHGGDIAMLFAAEHPAEARLIFSLDNRRMPIPRVRRPRICSARSSDQPADPGVLPSPNEQAHLGMVVITLSNVRHDDMSDHATTDQKAAMLGVLRACLLAR